MVRLMNPVKVKADATNILAVLKANPEFSMKGITVAGVEADMAQLDTTIAQIDALEFQITPLRNQRDELLAKLNETCTRARAGVKGYFGPDSDQYELAGGTRASERRRGGRKPATEPPTPPPAP